MGIFDKILSLFHKTPATPATPSTPAPSRRTSPPAPAKAAAPTGAQSVPDVSATTEERRHHPRTNAREGTRVLVIDDSTTVVFAFKKIFKSVGLQTLAALDAETGIELARSDLPDLIFLDIVLPGMNGFAALRQIRRDPLTRNIPVIMISSNEQATEQFFGAKIGADDFMKKPFARLEVFARIERLLDANQVPRRLNLSADQSEIDPGPVPAAPKPGISQPR